jgi:DNA-binding GntR family transcriptional regulator
MGFGKILALLLGLAALAFAVRTALTGTAGRDTAAQSAPKRQLDNVRQRAKELEREQQKAADDLARHLDQ